MAESSRPRSLGTAASLQTERLRQLRAMASVEIKRIVEEMRQATAVPRLRYHVRKHRDLLGVDGEAGYLHALREHLAHDHLRLFTYLRAKDRVPFWELVAPDTGTTLVYNEAGRSIWSFLQPKNADARMRAFETDWIEVVRTPEGWRFLEDWRWRT